MLGIVKIPEIHGGDLVDDRDRVDHIHPVRQGAQVGQDLFTQIIHTHIVGADHQLQPGGCLLARLMKDAGVIQKGVDINRLALQL